MNALLNASVFAGHPLLEKLFLLVGGASILAHLVNEGIPRVTALIMNLLLSQKHPAVRNALIDNEASILNGIEAAKIQAQASIDAAKAQSAAPAAAPAAATAPQQ